MGARPLTLRCKHCSKGEDFRDYSSRPSGKGLFRTGRTKVARKYGRKYEVELTEIVHDRCGHVFWSNHYSIQWLKVKSPTIDSRSGITKAPYQGPPDA